MSDRNDRVEERKRARTRCPVHELIARRWSPVAFREEPVEPEKLCSLLEAARWAPSSYNEQPWRFLAAARHDDPESHRRLVECLMDVNRRWAARAPVLILTIAKTRFSHAPQRENRHAFHDVGLATAQLTLQATALGLYVHQMAGFSPQKARERFAALDIPNPTPLFVLLVDEARRAGREDEARRLAQLAVALEYDTPALRALAHVETSLPTPTPSPASTPPPLAGKFGTLPSSSPTPQTEQGRYEWVVVERRPLTCVEQPGDELLLVVYVEDANGTPLSGIPLLAQGENDTQRFFTGLKADNPGYADLEVQENRYTVRVDRGQSEVALDLTMPIEGAKCSTISDTDEAATTMRGWVVRFRRVAP